MQFCCVVQAWANKRTDCLSLTPTSITATTAGQPPSAAPFGHGTRYRRHPGPENDASCTQKQLNKILIFGNMVRFLYCRAFCVLRAWSQVLEAFFVVEGKVLQTVCLFFLFSMPLQVLFYFYFYFYSYISSIISVLRVVDMASQTTIYDLSMWLTLTPLWEREKRN